MRKFLLVIALILAPLSAQVIPGRGLPTKTIAIVRDQKSPYFEAMVDGFLEILKPLARDQYQLRVKPFNPAGPTLADVRNSLNQALDDPSVDAIFTAGITASHSAMNMSPDERTKPVIAGNMEFSDLENKLITEDESSKLPNYSFVLVPRRLRSDLLTLASLAKTRTIDVLIDSRIIEDLGAELSAGVDRFGKDNNLDLQIIPLSPDDLSLANLSSNTRAVYVPVLPRLTIKERQDLFKTLTRKKKISFSMLGPDDVEAGAFGSLAPKISETLNRRFALNLHQALLGIDTIHLPVVLRLADQLKINLVTAREIGWSPDYDTGLTATFFKQDEVIETNGKLTLEAAMAMAARRNPDVKSARAAWQSSQADVLATRAQFSTFANLTGSAGGQMNRSRINTITTPKYAGSASLGVEVNRVLYSDRLYQQIASLDQRAGAARLDEQSITLDTIETTASAYLDCLLAEAVHRIQRTNVLLAQENLGLAEIRKEIGAMDETDSLRWQAALASARSNLIAADGNRRNARAALNVKLAVDTRKNWALEDVSLNEKETYFLNDSLASLVKNKDQFQGFIRFIRALSTANSPELQSFDFNLRAEGIRLVERKRRRTRPVVQLNAGVQRIFEDSDISTGGGQNEWTVGVGFTLPFLETDLRRAEVSKIEAGINQLQAQRQRAVYLVEQRALAACYNMAASHPAVRLSRLALAASEKNYKNIREKYSLGQVNVVTLIDAQTNYLNQQQAEANAIYTYLKDVISLQRAIAWFEYTKSAAEVADFIQHYRDFQKTGSVHVRVLQKK